jgi:hypothetical protein
MPFAFRVWRMLLVWVDFHISLCGYSPFFLLCKFRSSSKPTNKTLMHHRKGRYEKCAPNSNSSISVRVQNQAHSYVKFIFHSGRYYYLKKYWPFLVNHPVYWITLRAKFKQLYLGKSSESGTFLYEVYISQWPIPLPQKVLTFPCESSCMLNYIARQIQTDLSR